MRSAGGAVAVFTLVLYPYVYLLARTAFLAQGAELVEAARGLGLSRRGPILRVAVPMARPAILGGVALALMETLADFGTVNLLGVQTFTNAIYKVWFGAFDRDAALQLGTMLVSVTLTLLLLERASRGRARYAGESGARELAPVRLRGPAPRPRRSAPLVLLALVVAAPVAQLAVWSVQSISRRSAAPGVRHGGAQQPAAGRDVARAGGGRGAGARLRAARERLARRPGAAVRVATIGYGLPGLGGGRGGDRAAGLDRPPAGRRWPGSGCCSPAP